MFRNTGFGSDAGCNGLRRFFVQLGVSGDTARHRGIRRRRHIRRSFRPSECASARHPGHDRKSRVRPHYRGLHAVFSYHRRQNSFSRLHSPTEEKDKAERQSVLDYLNHYKLVAIGIREDILDADIYRDWMLSPFVRDWNAAADFIQRERWKWDSDKRTWTYHKPLFTNYQAVARLWSSEAVDLSEAYSVPPQAPSGPGDEAFPETDGARSE